MESKATLSREILEEDLQIMRCTLAAISDDVQRYSETSAQALAEALEKLDLAQREFSRPSPSIGREGKRPEPARRR